MNRKTAAVVIVAAIIVLAGGIEIGSALLLGSRDTFFTNGCVITGIGGFEFRVLSDSGESVNGATITAIDRLSCNGDWQVVYINNFSPMQGGWSEPVFPSQAEPGGELNFTVVYQGGTYAFGAFVPPMGTNCVTLHVPSGNVTTTNVMNGSGSYCS